MNKQELLTLMGGKKTPWYLAGGVVPIAAYQPKGASSLASSYINIANPGTYNAAPGAEPDWNTTDGWIGTGSNKYLTTGIVANTGTWSFIVRFSDAPSVDNPIGSLTTNKKWSYTPNYGGSSVRAYINNTETIVRGSLMTDGVFCLSGGKAYIDGIFIQDCAGVAVDSDDIYLLAANLDDAPTRQFGGKIQAIAIYNSTLTPAQVLTITSEINKI